MDSKQVIDESIQNNFGTLMTGHCSLKTLSKTLKHIKWQELHSYAKK